MGRTGGLLMKAIVLVSLVVLLGDARHMTMREPEMEKKPLHLNDDENSEGDFYGRVEVPQGDYDFYRKHGDVPSPGIGH
uniref:Uncharacterized protein n=1 Tax=Vitis vinifera TaxID=29760 RepID=A5ACL7_VITVI|nr:hypothetical protein VITISV_043598 [Vitis vinifera]